MRKFMKITTLIESVIKKSEVLFSEGNRLDLTKGGEDWETEDIFFVLESYVAKKNINKGEIINPQNMKGFIEKVWDILWTISSFSKTEIEKWFIENKNTTFVKIKLEDRNYYKQLCIIKIVNEICKQTYGFNLIDNIPD